MMPLPCFMSSLDPFFRWLLTNNSTLKKCRIRTNIRRRIQKIKKNTKHCHQRKMERDNVCIENNNNNNKRNRHFSRKHQTEKKRKKRKRVKFNRKERIVKAKEQGPDQNAINLSSKVLTTLQKSVFAKGPSSIPTRNDVYWLKLRKELDSFINQLRYFANNAFQKGQEAEVAKIASNQLNERADPKIPGEPHQRKINLVQYTNQSRHQIKT